MEKHDDDEKSEKVLDFPPVSLTPLPHESRKNLLNASVFESFVISFALHACSQCAPMDFMRLLTLLRFTDSSLLTGCLRLAGLFMCFHVPHRTRTKFCGHFYDSAVCA